MDNEAYKTKVRELKDMAAVERESYYPEDEAMKERPVTDVRAAQSEVSMALASLSEELDLLENNLAPIMRSPENLKEVGEDQTSPYEPSSEIVHEIRDTQYRIEHYTARLRNMRMLLTC